MDDDLRSLKLVERFLKIERHKVTAFTSPDEAVAALDDRQVDLVITDRAMTGTSGDEVALAAMSKQADVPVILLTGFGEQMKDNGEKPEGVDLVMSKPVTLADLRTGMTELLGAQTCAQ